jgi:hypothetical protein
MSRVTAKILIGGLQHDGRVVAILATGLLGTFERLAAGETQADVARTYNVDATTIGRLLTA